MRIQDNVNEIFYKVLCLNDLWGLFLPVYSANKYKLLVMK